LPSDAEWEALMTAIGGAKTAGKHLKARSGFDPYASNEEKPLDTYGFSAFPAGLAIQSEESYNDNAGFATYWWSAVEDVSNGLYAWSMDSFKESAYYIEGAKAYFFSVRCVQDYSKEDKSPKIIVIPKSNNFQAGTSTEFLPYAKLNEKIETNKELERKKAEEEREALIAAIEKDPAPAIAELEEEAKKWQSNAKKTGKSEGNFFSYIIARVPSPCYECGFNYLETWKAISKMKMGDCPAKSVWTMHNALDEGSYWGNKLPPKCKSVTPKVISNYKGEEGFF